MDTSKPIKSLSFDGKVAFFFEDSPINHPLGRYHSTLSLILKDIEKCGAPGSNELAFPRAICSMVAFDLLAKMHAGSDNTGKVRERFTQFTQFALGKRGRKQVGEKVYAFRNALHHSYRLASEWKRKGAVVDWRFRLIDDINEQRLMWNYKQSTIINLPSLQKELCQGITKLRSDVKQNKFEPMFDKYGWLIVGNLSHK